LIRLPVDTASGERLDAYLARHLPDISRSQAAALITAGHVRLNGTVPRKSEKVSPGDVIEVDVPEPVASTVEPEDIPLVIVYQDKDLAVIEKPAGLVVHPAPGHARGTLVNALLHHVRDLSGIGGVMRPGIVQRLDKDTSGLLLIAKHDKAHRALSAALKKREIRRAYIAAAWGHLREDHVTVDAPIGRSPTDRKRMAVVPTGRHAVTHFQRLERWPAADLIRATLETGRTHQIRVHLLSIGHPVVGDPLYAPHGERGISGPAQQWARMFAKRINRQFLHAAELEFDHPRTKERMSFVSPLPPDLAGAVDWARASLSGGGRRGPGSR